MEAAAAAGLPEAEFNLGRLAAEAGDVEAAEARYRAAAVQGFGPAQFNLALLLLERGGEAPTLEALKWFDKAAAAGVDYARAARNEVAAALGPDALERARALP